MRYSIVLLDADETLFDFKTAERHAIFEVFSRHGIAPDEETFMRYHAINHALWRKNERGEIGKEQLAVQRFADFLSGEGRTEDPVQWNIEYLQALSHQSQLIEGAEALCRELSKYAKLYIATNGFATAQRGRLNGSAIAPYITKEYISEELGAEKPSSAYFEAIFTDLSVTEKREVLLIGDSLSSDMPGGIAAGIDTCWYNPGKLPCTLRGITYEVHRLQEVLPLVLGEDFSRTV